MKLGRILRESLEGAVPRLVVVQPEQNRVIDLAVAEYLRMLHLGATPAAARRISAVFFPPSMREALEAGPNFLMVVTRCVESVEEEEAAIPIEGVQWLPPVDPPAMRTCQTFEQHLRNTFSPTVPEQYYEMPLYYKGNPGTLIAHEQTVSWPAYASSLDYGLEIGFVVGRSGQDLTPENACAHLFGVTVLNAFNAPEYQRREMAGLLGPAKGQDFATAIGPWITTADELDIHHLTMMARVNGEEWSRGVSSSALWSVEEILSYLSRDEGVQVGELIGSGTVGFGCGLELGRALKSGDVVELEVEGIGTLRNTIGTPAQSGWTPTPRKS